MKLRTHLILATLCVLSACSESTYDVQYYLDHPDKLQAKLAECEKQHKFKTDTNCINASEAFTKRMFHGIGELMKTQ